MITVKDLMQCETQSSPDGKHWEPVIPDGSLMSWRVRLQDALAVWRGEAIAIRQTTKADIPKDYMERNSARDAARRNREAQPSAPAPWREAVNPPGERGIYLVRIGDQTHVAQFDPRMVSAKWWKAYGLPSRLAQEPTHWMPLPTGPDAAAPEAPAQAEQVAESMPLMVAQALEALDELEAAARGDEPFNHFAAPLIRQTLKHYMLAAAPEAPAQNKHLAEEYERTLWFAGRQKSK